MLPALPRKYHAASIWLLYAVGFLPAAYDFWLGATGRLPGNPVKAFEHLLGLWALRFRVATMAITPLRDLFGINWIGPRWVKLHKLVYIIAAAGALHFAMSVKVVRLEPWIYIALVTLFLAWRAVRRNWRNHNRAYPRPT